MARLTRSGHWRPLRHRPVLLALVAVALAVTVAGCAGHTGTKAGGAVAPITLRIGADDGPGRPAAAEITRFAAEVAALSEGSIRVEPVLRADGPGNRDWDQRVVHMIQGGALEGGIVPTRAFDTEGVRSLRVLNAPFLITSDELHGRVTSSPLATQMLEGLEPVGLVGLALVPESLRHPFGFEAPLLSVDDYAGVGIRVPRSTVASALFRAFGARPDDIAGDAFNVAVGRHELAAAEGSFDLAATLPRLATATGNVTFFPRTNAVVLSRAAYDRLDEAQQRVVREAAVRTRTAAIAENPADAEGARAYCRAGGTVVLATPTDLAGLEHAAAPVYADLEQDPGTRSLIAAVRAMDTRTATVHPPACAPPAAVDPAPTAEPDAEPFPDGVYRATITQDFLVARGLSAPAAADLAGTSTLVFRRGHWEHHQSSDVDPDGCQGTYAVADGRVTVTTNPDASPGCEAGRAIFSARFERTSAGLRLLDAHSDIDGDVFASGFWGGPVWAPVG